MVRRFGAPERREDDLRMLASDYIAASVCHILGRSCEPPTRGPPHATMADAPSPPEHEPTLRERIERAKVLARRARPHWLGSFAVFCVGCAITLYVASNVKRVFESECVVLVKPALKTDEQESPQERAVKLTPKLRDTLKTRSRLEPIIREFKLYPETVESRSIVDAVNVMASQVRIQGRDSETFVIAFEDDDAERARVITQRLAETMMDDFKRANVTTKVQEADFLGAELTRAEQELETANRALASFLAAHPEFAADNSPFVSSLSPRGPGSAAAHGPGAPAGTPATTSTDPQLASLLRQKARLEAEMKSLGTLPPPPPNETLASLARGRDEAARKAAQAQADLADKRAKLTDQHPDMAAAKAQAEAAATALRNAEAQLDAAKKAQAGTPTQAPTTELASKVADLQKEIGARQAELAKAGGAAAATAAVKEPALHPVVALEIDWARMLRAVGDARAVHEDIRRRAERARLKASATEVAGRGQMEILDAAFKPTQPKKGRRNTAMVGAAVSLLAAIAFAAARVLTNGTIYDAEDVLALKLVPVLGVIPKLPPPPAGDAPGTAIEPRGPEGVSRAG